MGASDIVAVTIAVAASAGLPVQAFGVGMLAGYHTHYQDRYRIYTSQAGMAADGFSTTEPLYRAAGVYWSQNGGAQLAIGRRALPPTQVLNLLLGSASAGDVYKFTAVGSDGVAHAISYTSTGTPATDATSIAALFAVTGGPVTHVGTGPAVTMTGTANVNAVIVITITTGGILATSQFSWTLNGVLQAANVATAATVVLTGTGLTANMAAGTYVVGDTYTCTAIINCGTVTHSTATLVFTQSGGKLTDIQGWMGSIPSTIIQLTDATSDPGIATDLAAIYAANTLAWYGVALDSNSNAEIKAAEAWIEATGLGGKVGFFHNADYANGVGGVAQTDVFTVSQTSAYKRSIIGNDSSQVLSYLGVAAMAYAGSQNPGSYTLAFKTFAGVPQDSDASLPETQRLVINSMTTSSPGTGGKNGNYYVPIPGFWPGVTPSGQFMDLTIFLDWLQVNVQSAVYAVLKSLPKTPYTDNGIGLIRDAIKGVLKLAATPAYNALDPATLVVNVPTAAAVAATSRAARDLPGVTFTCRYTGAIQTTEIQGTVSL